MAYTFGGAVGSRANFTSNISCVASGSAIVTTGWYFPTTLTAGRHYWGAGSLAGCRVGTTTSDITLHTDGATTDGVYTAAAGITTNAWWFVSTIGVFNNTGPSAIWRMYLGTESTPPASVTVTTTTAQVGNFTGNSSFTFGNNTANSTSFQGEITDCSMIATTAFGIGTPLGIAASTALTAAEEERILQTYIMPMWLGRPGEAMQRPMGGNAYDRVYWSANNIGSMIRQTNTLTSTTWIAPTLTSSVFSSGGSPRPAYDGPLSLPFVKR